jgi:hypothetical protein
MRFSSHFVVSRRLIFDRRIFSGVSAARNLPLCCPTHDRRTLCLSPSGCVQHSQAVARTAEGLFLPILLSSRGAQARKTVAVNRALPDKEFIDRERVAAASFVQREKATAHGGYDLCLAANYPAFGPRRWQISDRQWAAIRSHYVLGFGAQRVHRIKG